MKHDDFTPDNSIIIYDGGWSTYEEHNNVIIYEMMNGDIYIVHSWANPYSGSNCEITKVTLDEACVIMYDYEEHMDEIGVTQ